MDTYAGVFIGDLPASIEENFLRELFREIGTIQQGRITIKKNKNLEKSFAFVEFDSREQAQKAIRDVNYTKLDGCPIRICWSDANTKRIIKSGAGSLFISGLDESIEVSQLHDAFSNFGEIISCKIPATKMEDGTFKSRGYGYIQFYKPEDAARAKNDLAEASINGKPIKIEDYKKPERKNPEETFTNVYIKPLKADKFKTQQDLIQLMQQFGELVILENGSSPAIMKDAEGKSKEFGFCNFKTHEAAVSAVNELNGKPFGDGKEDKYVCCRAQTKKERQAFIARQNQEFRRRLSEQTQGRNLYVKNFDASVTDEEFEAYFKKFGEIESCTIRRDPQIPHESKGFGFVLYKTKEDAENAINNACLEPLKDRTPYVGMFESREVRDRKKAGQQAAKQKAAKNQGYMASANMLPNAALQVPVSMGAGTLAAPVVPQSYKERLKTHLLENAITGSKMKAALSSISEEQAKVYCDDNEKLRKFVEKFQ